MKNIFTESEKETILNALDLLQAQIAQSSGAYISFKNRINSIRRKLFKEEV